MIGINRKALHYSGGIGCLMTLANLYEYHTRRHRMCRNLIDGLETKVDDFGAIEERDIVAGHNIFQRMDSQLEDMVEETGINGEDLLASLCVFNIEELAPLHRHLKARLKQFIESFPNIENYDVARAGHRLWQRMETEIIFNKLEGTWTVED